MNQAALRKLTIARSRLIIDHPFFGMLALRLNLVEDNSIPTLAVNGRSVFYNADFVMKLDDGLTKSAMAHEVMHCVFQHISRRGPRDPKRWNFAGDYAINQILKDSDFEIGPGWLIDPQYAGMTADAIYAMLPESPSGEALCDIMQSGEGGGDQHDQEGTGATEVEAMEWKIATMQAASVAKAKGKLPASMQRFVDDLPKPKVDWRKQLQRFFNQVAKDDYSWMHPNRKFLSQGLYLPGLWSETMGPIAIFIDTSGSISNDILQKFGAEIRAISASAQPSEIYVVYCDAAVNHVDVFRPDDKMIFAPHGGGGTDFRPPFEYLREKGIQPECICYLTDGYGPFPENPGTPTMWVMTTDVVAPFGETIRIEV